MAKSFSLTHGDLALLRPFWEEPVQREVLPNGATLIVRRDRSAPLASVQVWVKTGSVHEDALQGSGVSHYLEHLLFKGTERRAGREISATVQAHGGMINAYTTFDRTVYYIDLPSEHVGIAVDLLADMVLHSTLPADEVARERDVILREIDMVKDDPDQRLGETLFATAFRSHPYRFPVIGHREVFSSLTRDDLVAYYRARYVPNNLVIVVVGDVDPAAIRADVERHFGPSPRSRLAPLTLLPEPVALGPREDHRYEDVEVIRADLSWPIPGLGHPDAPGLELLAMVLGSGDSSILWSELREKARLVHSIDANCWNPGMGGLLSISFTCDAGGRERATARILALLQGLGTKGFSAARLRKAMRQLVVGEINARKTMSGQASRLGAAEVVVGDLSFTRSYFESLAAVDSAALTRLVRTYLVPRTLTAVSLNPLGDRPAAAAAGVGVTGAVDFEEVRLPNGARLLLRPDSRLPNLHLRFVLRAGPAQEAPGRRGSSALLATLLTKDTKRRTAAEIARRIEEVGGSFSAFTGNNALALALEVLPGDAALALETLSDAVFMPAFRADTLAREKEAQIADLKLDEDDVVTHGRKLLRRLFFGGHPLACDAFGDAAEVAAVTPADLRALHGRVLTAENAVLAVAGDFSRGRLLPALRRFLARLPRASGPAAAPAFAGPVSPGAREEIQPRAQAVVFQAFPGPGAASRDRVVADVMDEFFSGMSSGLFERVREEKGLAYFVRSSRILGLDGGMFYLYAGTAPGHVAEVLAEFEAEIRRVATGGARIEELRRCQTRLKAARRQALQTNASRALHASLQSLYGLTVNDAQEMDTAIDAVTLADLAGFADRYLRPDRRLQLVVRPESAKA